MDLHAATYGDPAAPPLVILHGLLGAGGNWATLSRNVFGDRFYVLAVDQRNHGRSPHTEGAFGYEDMADDLAAFLDAQGIESAHLLGHSMGGKTAMHFALKHPGRTDRLIVADIAPRAYPPHHLPLLETLLALEPSQYASRQEVDDALAESVSSWGVRQFLLKNLGREDGDYVWQPNLPAIRASYDAISGGMETDGRFDGPALFVRGERSDYVTDADVPAIRALFPSATLETIPKAGHWLHADQPDAFGDAVMRFLT